MFSHLLKFSIVNVLLTTTILIEPKGIIKLLNIFLGILKDQKGYRCYYPSLHGFMISGDITFL